MADEDPNAKLKQDVEALKLRLEQVETQKKLDAAKAPVDPGQRALEAATLQANIAEQEKKALTNSLPATEAKALEGTTSVDDKAGGMETKTLAYESAQAVAGEIARRLNGIEGLQRLVVYNEKDVAGLRQYEVFLAQVKLLREGFEGVEKDAAGPTARAESLEPITAGLKSMIDLLALFRSDVELKGRDASIEQDALVSVVGKQLDRTKIALFHPGLYPSLPSATDITTTTAFKELKGVADQRVKADKAVRKAEEAKTLHAPSTLAEVRARFDNLGAAHDAFLAQLVKPDPTSGQAPVAGLLQVDSLRAAGTYVLVLKALEAGGTVRITRNLWTFFASPRVYFSGAAIINMMLFDNTGKLVLSDVLYQHSGFTRIRGPQQSDRPGKNF